MALDRAVDTEVETPAEALALASAVVAGPEFPPAEGARATKRLIARSLTILYRDDGSPAVR